MELLWYLTGCKQKIYLLSTELYVLELFDSTE